MWLPLCNTCFHSTAPNGKIYVKITHSSLQIVISVMGHHLYILALYTLTWQTSFLECFPGGQWWLCLSCKAEEVLVLQLFHQLAGVFPIEQSASLVLHRQFHSMCGHATVSQHLSASIWCWDDGTGSLYNRCNWIPTWNMKEWKNQSKTLE